MSKADSRLVAWKVPRTVSPEIRWMAKCTSNSARRPPSLQRPRCSVAFGKMGCTRENSVYRKTVAKTLARSDERRSPSTSRCRSNPPRSRILPETALSFRTSSITCSSLRAGVRIRARTHRKLDPSLTLSVPELLRRSGQFRGAAGHVRERVGPSGPCAAASGHRADGGHRAVQRAETTARLDA